MMKARRVSMLLAVVVLSALTLFLLSLLDSEAGASVLGGAGTLPALPDTLLSCEETLAIGPDGNVKWETTVVIGKGGSGDLLLPFDFDDGGDPEILSGPVSFAEDRNGSPRPTVMVLGRTMLHLLIGENAARGDTFRVGGTLDRWYRREDRAKPYGEFGLTRRYENFSDLVYADFRLNLVLPPGMVVHSIEQVIPDFDPKKNPRPPYGISRPNGRSRVTISVENLGPGDVALLDLNIRPGRRGLIPLIGGLIAAILYLVFFRDVLKPKETE